MSKTPEEVEAKIRFLGTLAGRGSGSVQFQERRNDAEELVSIYRALFNRVKALEEEIEDRNNKERDRDLLD